ncbi:hypothetical protein ACKI1H_27120 [Pseudomonas sp. YH-1]|uniref:hypothetical protein n=1 Tax=Pseudomonas sp. YH-1 TaxID=3384787 RepID=UPI003F7D048C
MIASYFLIVLFLGPKGEAMTNVPMESLDQCKTAAAQAKTELEGTFTLVRTSCLRAAQ